MWFGLPLTPFQIAMIEVKHLQSLNVNGNIITQNIIFVSRFLKIKAQRFFSWSCLLPNLNDSPSIPFCLSYVDDNSQHFHSATFLVGTFLNILWISH
jgi:hypothetical protein